MAAEGITVCWTVGMKTAIVLCSLVALCGWKRATAQVPPTPTDTVHTAPYQGPDHRPDHRVDTTFHDPGHKVYPNATPGTHPHLRTGEVVPVDTAIHKAPPGTIDAAPTPASPPPPPQQPPPTATPKR